MQPPEPLERRSARSKARLYGLERLQNVRSGDSGSCGLKHPWGFKSPPFAFGRCRNRYLSHGCARSGLLPVTTASEVEAKSPARNAGIGSVAPGISTRSTDSQKDRGDNGGFLHFSTSPRLPGASTSPRPFRNEHSRSTQACFTTRPAIANATAEGHGHRQRRRVVFLESSPYDERSEAGYSHRRAILKRACTTGSRP